LPANQGAVPFKVANSDLLALGIVFEIIIHAAIGVDIKLPYPILLDTQSYYTGFSLRILRKDLKNAE